MGDPRVFRLHIGWPKTGTTTLQKHVWPFIPGHRYLGKTPFEGEKNGHTFDLVHMLAYASREKYSRSKNALFRSLEKVETELFGEINDSIPLLLSDEGILSSLLKPSQHGHHGYSTASLEQMMERLLDLEEHGHVRFDLLITERNPIDLLHAYYTQMFHLVRQLPGLSTFQGYVRAGTTNKLRGDLGFHYLRPGYVTDQLRRGFGADRVHSISMDQLFDGSKVRLHEWCPILKDFQLSTGLQENRRSRGHDVKITHLRPIWVKKKPFRLMPFIRNVRGMYRQEYMDHSKLEVEVRIGEEDKELLEVFLTHGEGRS